MMGKSFTSKVKNEILSICAMQPRAERAFVSAVSHTAGSIGLSSEGMRLIIALEDESVRTFLTNIIGKLYGLVNIVPQKRELIIKETVADKLLSDCGILSEKSKICLGIKPKLISSTLTKTAYIRGAFIGCGSVNVNRGYHLEFSVSNSVLANDIIQILNGFSIASKTLIRCGKTVVYIKGADGVSDCLALLGAGKAVLELNSGFVDKQIKQLANRRSNCDLANIDKTISAGERQINAIQGLIQSGEFNNLDQKLKDVAKARLDNPETSFAEIAQLLDLTKSCVMHRLNKIIDIHKCNELK